MLSAVRVRMGQVICANFPFRVNVNEQDNEGSIERLGGPCVDWPSSGRVRP